MNPSPWKQSEGQVFLLNYSRSQSQPVAETREEAGVVPTITINRAGYHIYCQYNSNTNNNILIVVTTNSLGYYIDNTKSDNITITRISFGFLFIQKCDYSGNPFSPLLRIMAFLQNSFHYALNFSSAGSPSYSPGIF